MLHFVLSGGFVSGTKYGAVPSPCFGAVDSAAFVVAVGIFVPGVVLRLTSARNRDSTQKVRFQYDSTKIQ